MLILRFGLTIAALGCLVATFESSRAGYPIEIAIVRGLLAFMALSFVAYLGELVIATAPPPKAAAPSGDGREGTDGSAIAAADDQVEGPTQRPDEPVRLPDPDVSQRVA
jgi:hypothetical protein